ncbi:MAG: AEC family transporter [Desulfobacterales bacterium]|nr:AEC family transporter [Desulfobacterales bacterium]
MLIHTSVSVFNTIVQLFVISIAAGLLVRKKMILANQIQALSTITVNIFLPCLIVTKIIAGFHPEQLENWWILPLSGFLISVTGLLISNLFFRLRPEKRPAMVVASLPNAIYVVLPIGQVLFADDFDSFALYCFLFVLGLNPVMWSIGKVMLAGKTQQRIHWKDFFTPPLLAIFISVFMAFTGASKFIPAAITAPLDLLGQATVPVSIFVLGAVLGSLSIENLPPLKDILIVGAVKYLVVPFIVFTVLYHGQLYSTMPLLCALLIIEAAAPPAANLVIITENYCGDTQAVSSMMLVQYPICLFFMPLWIAAWQYQVF